MHVSKRDYYVIVGRSPEVGERLAVRAGFK